MDLERLHQAQRVGRRIGIALFAVIVSSFVIVCSAQILYQGFHDSEIVVKGNCRTLVVQVASSVSDSREAARKVADERVALRAFRNALEPLWLTRTQLDPVCRGEPWAREAISAIDEWRWAEENAIRYESVDLAPSRRKVQEVMAKLGIKGH